MCVSYRVHERRLGVCNQDKNISVQTVFINPIIQALRDVNPRRVNQHYIVSEQWTSSLWPVDADKCGVTEAIVAEGVGKLADAPDVLFFGGALCCKIRFTALDAFNLFK